MTLTIGPPILCPFFSCGQNYNCNYNFLVMSFVVTPNCNPFYLQLYDIVAHNLSFGWGQGSQLKALFLVVLPNNLRA